jgi:CheY-like chemotaxis protein
MNWSLPGKVIIVADTRLASAWIELKKFNKKDYVLVTDASTADEMSNAGKLNFYGLIIFVELDWSEDQTNLKGYDFAYDLLKSRSDIKPFHLRFISFLEPKDILDRSNHNNSLFAAKAPPILITSQLTLNDVLPIRRGERIPVSSQKFAFLLYYMTSSSGILDRLIHDVDRLLGLETIPAKRLELLYTELSRNRLALDTDTIGEIGRARSVSILEQRQMLPAIRRRIAGLQQRKERKDKFVVAKNGLLVEDEVETGKRLQKDLAGYFDQLDLVHSGTEALEVLKKNDADYTVLLVDMELQIGRVDDSIQGIDLIEYTRENYPWICIRPLTGLSRYGLHQLLGEEYYHRVLAKKQLADGQITINFYEYAKALQQEVEDRKVARDFDGPRTSRYWSTTSYYLGLMKIANPDKRSDLWKRVMLKANEFLNRRLDGGDKENKLSGEMGRPSRKASFDAEGIQHLELLLTHRLVLLSYAQDHKGKPILYAEDGGVGEDEYRLLPGFSKALIKDMRQFFSKLGISYNAYGDVGPLYRFTVNDSKTIFFDEEADFLSRRKNRAEFRLDDPVDLGAVTKVLGVLVPELREAYEGNKPFTKEGIKELAEKINKDVETGKEAVVDYSSLNVALKKAHLNYIEEEFERLPELYKLFLESIVDVTGSKLLEDLYPGLYK